MFRYSTLDRGNKGGGRAPRPCIAFHNAFEDVHGMTISTSACAEWPALYSVLYPLDTVEQDVGLTPVPTAARSHLS